MDLQVEFSDTGLEGPFEPLAKIAISDWSELEVALVRATEGRPPLGFYRVRFASGGVARLLAWYGEDGAFEVLGHNGGGWAMGHSQPS